MSFEGSAAARLRELRTQYGYSQEFVASELDVRQGSISNWECGRQPVPQVYEDTLARLYQVPRMDLFDSAANFKAPTLILPRRCWRRLRRSPTLPPYPIKGTMAEAMALSPLAEEVYYTAVGRAGQESIDNLNEKLSRDSAHELLFALHLFCVGARMVRTTLTALGCDLYVVDGPKTRRLALSAERHVLVVQQENEVAIFVPQPWILIPRWNRCCRPDFLTVFVGERRRPIWGDVEIDGTFHKENEDVDAERAAALGLPRLGYSTSMVRNEKIAARVWGNLKAQR